jgi:hypothetical protein
MGITVRFTAFACQKISDIGVQFREAVRVSYLKELKSVQDS